MKKLDTYQEDPIAGRGPRGRGAGVEPGSTLGGVEGVGMKPRAYDATSHMHEWVSLRSEKNTVNSFLAFCGSAEP